MLERDDKSEGDDAQSTLEGKISKASLLHRGSKFIRGAIQNRIG